MPPLPGQQCVCGVTAVRRDGLLRAVALDVTPLRVASMMTRTSRRSGGVLRRSSTSSPDEWGRFAPVQPEQEVCERRDVRRYDLNLVPLYAKVPRHLLSSGSEARLVADRRRMCQIGRRPRCLDMPVDNRVEHVAQCRYPGTMREATLARR